jgi:hypothetical protein
MRGSKAILIIAVVALLAGCSWSQRIEGKVAPDTVSLADRCGLIMQAAMPFAQLDLGDRGSRSPEVSTIIAQVAATRADLPKDVATGRELMAECTFQDNVMTAFRWTKGGPPPSPGSDQTQPIGEAPAAGPPSPAGKSQPFH